MSVSSMDPRIEQTKKKIKTAFTALMEEDSFDNISITDIVKRAGVNRSTFYDHYQDKYQLVIEVFLDTAFLHDEPYDYQEDVAVSPEYLINRVQKSLELCKQHKNISQVIYSQCFRSPYFQDISKYLTQFHISLQNEVLADEATLVVPQQLLANFSNAGFNYLYMMWINGELNFTSRQMAIYIIKLNISLIGVMKGIDMKSQPIYNWE